MLMRCLPYQVCGYLGLCTSQSGNKAEEQDKVVSHRKLLAAAVAEAAQREQHLLRSQQADGAVKDDQTCQLCEMAVTYLKVGPRRWYCNSLPDQLFALQTCMLGV